MNNHTSTSKHSKKSPHCCGHEHDKYQNRQDFSEDEPDVVADGALKKTRIRILQMDCPTEESMIRQKLKGMSGLHSMSFNLIDRVLTVSYRPDILPNILSALKELGFEPEIGQVKERKNNVTKPYKKWWILVVAIILSIIAEVVDWVDGSIWAMMLCSVLAIVLSGIGTYRKGLMAITHLNLNINALMSIAVTGAVLIGHWPEAAMVMVLFAIAEKIEDKSLNRARHAIKKLISLVPQEINVRQADGSYISMLPDDVKIDSIVQIRPGERIGLDGVIITGQSMVDQAPITGESSLVDKGVGDEVYAGSINQQATIEIRITALANDSTLARIIHAVEDAQEMKAPTQRFVDKFAHIYTPIVCILALLVAVVPPLILSGDWLVWIYKALTLLVIACPCALVISTPVTVVSGLAMAAKRGILIKGGEYLEKSCRLKILALDKTGTITAGKPEITDFIPLAEDEDYVLLVAQSLANQSNHPVSQALVSHLPKENKFLVVQKFTVEPGRGTSAIINQRHYWLGNHRFIHELDFCSLELEAKINQLEKQGKTVVLLAENNKVLALFAVSDVVKESSFIAIKSLKVMGILPVMLSGDNLITVTAIANKVGISEAFGGLLPEDKLTKIDQYAQQGMVGMVGDGINDAPALAKADIGFAMGVMGTDTAIETADVALMDDDLRKIPQLIRLSKKTKLILIENITLALVIKFLFVIITIMGMGTMWMAVFADMGVSLIVVANGLRLLRHKLIDDESIGDSKLVSPN